MRKTEMSVLKIDLKITPKNQEKIFFKIPSMRKIPIDTNPTQRSEVIFQYIRLRGNVCVMADFDKAEQSECRPCEKSAGM